MQDNFFTADSHFGHTNLILKDYAGRPFDTIEEMDEQLIENWNRVVKPGDNVYHLGDFAWRDAEPYIKRLNGTIHKIKGNHGRGAEKAQKRFQWYKDVHVIQVGKQKIFLSHYSHEVWNKSHHGVWHLYGHSHNSLADHPNRLSFDVGVDAVAASLSGIPQGVKIIKGSTKREDYRPISYDEVAARMAQKKWEPIDHHGVDCG